MYHVQCLLKNNNTFQTSWIPKKYATLGKILKLKENGIWTNGWEVVTCGHKELSKKILEREQNYKKMRKITDI